MLHLSRNVLFLVSPKKEPKKAPPARRRRLIPLAAAASGYTEETGAQYFYIAKYLCAVFIATKHMK